MVCDSRNILVLDRSDEDIEKVVQEIIDSNGLRSLPVRAFLILNDMHTWQFDTNSMSGVSNSELDDFPPRHQIHGIDAAPRGHRRY